MIEARSSPLPDELLALKRFHGHLGPYVVMGHRMGSTARQRYPGKIHAIVFCGSKRPMSCMADGVQFSSCCTLGKANIEIVEDGQPAAIFTDGLSSLKITIRHSIIDLVEEKMTRESEEELSFTVYQMDDEALLMIEIQSTT